nr:putative Ig domain-containing protein [Pseudorhodoferax sp. Leaf265]
MVPSNAFADADSGTALTYTVRLEDGGALPSWLTFDASSLRFSGTPGHMAVGAVQIRITATDAQGLATSDVFTLTVVAAPAPVIRGTAGADTLTGTAEADTVQGEAGDDRLDGGAGADTMAGGTGNDTYVVDNAADVVLENVNEGIDLVQSSVSYTLAANVEKLTLTGTTATHATGNALNNTLTGNSAANVLDGGTGADTLVGGTGNDTYVVDNAADVVTEGASAGTDLVLSSVSHMLATNVEQLTLTGTAAINATGNTLTNTLTGNGAANVLDGGAGADTLAGGAGDDTYVVDNTADKVLENADEGTDLVRSSVSHTLAAHVEHLTLTGTAAINATGNSLNNSLTGNSAANVLNGGAGADTLAGGAGNDTYVVDDAADLVTENANEGFDFVQSSVSYTLAANVEKLTLTGTVATHATGNALNNVLTGNSAANVLDGGEGADTLAGGTGNDTYIVDHTADVVTEGASAGTDLVLSSVSYTLAANVEQLTLTGTAALNATGNTLANTLTGNSAANVLNGGSGADTLVGRAGDDTYVVDNTADKVVEAADEGVDLVQSSVTYTLAAHVEHLTLTGTAAINATGNNLDNRLTGNAAANVLNGGAGADTLAGGAGNDTYMVDSAGDQIVENSDEGTDLVQTGISYTLAANVENLTLTGAAAVQATGNAQANVLTGNSAANTLIGLDGNDTLNGGTGADTLIGGLGDDIYLVDNASDVTTENADEGVDTVQSGVTRTLGAHLENLTLTGTASISGTGNSLDNVLTGNTAANTLSGAAGHDTLIGGKGADNLIGGDGNDIYVLRRGDGADRITENGSAATNQDTARFGADIAADQLWFRQVGNDLEISVLGTGDRFSVGNWYLGAEYQVERFESGDSLALMSSQVQQLVQAMAAFAPPSAGQTTMPADYAATLQPVIAANWQ